MAVHLMAQPGDIVIADRKFWRVGEDGDLKPIMLRKWQSFNGSQEGQITLKKKRGLA